MKLTTLAEPLLEFGTGTHICPRTGIEHMGVYDKRDELRRTELRIGVVGRGEGIDLLDDWLEKNAGTGSSVKRGRTCRTSSGGSVASTRITDF
jgi:hypothetical protein